MLSYPILENYLYDLVEEREDEMGPRFGISKGEVE